MMKSSKTILALALIGGMGLASANSVFTWKGSSGHQVYSDTPRNLSTRNVSTMNIRSHTVTKINDGVKTDTAGGQIGTSAPANAEKSLSEQQADLSAKIAADNKKKEEENKKIEEENKRVKDENCTRAKLNLNNVQTSTRVSEREKLIAGYQKDIERNCN